MILGYFLFSWFFWFFWWYVGRWSLTLLDLLYFINMGLCSIIHLDDSWFFSKGRKKPPVFLEKPNKTSGFRFKFLRICIFRVFDRFKSIQGIPV